MQIESKWQPPENYGKRTVEIDVHMHIRCTTICNFREHEICDFINKCFIIFKTFNSFSGKYSPHNVTEESNQLPHSNCPMTSFMTNLITVSTRTAISRIILTSTLFPKN